MPGEGTAYCNRVQRQLLFFFPIHHNLTVSHLRATLVTLFHCSQRNQKLPPADAGPKTNALQPLLDRHETPLLCWKNWKRYQRQTVRLYRPHRKKVCEFHQRATFQSQSFTCSRKRAIVVFGCVCVCVFIFPVTFFLFDLSTLDTNSRTLE